MTTRAHLSLYARGLKDIGVPEVNSLVEREVHDSLRVCKRLEAEVKAKRKDARDLARLFQELEDKFDEVRLSSNSFTLKVEAEAEEEVRKANEVLEEQLRAEVRQKEREILNQVERLEKTKSQQSRALKIFQAQCQEEDAVTRARLMNQHYEELTRLKSHQEAELLNKNSLLASLNQDIETKKIQNEMMRSQIEAKVQELGNVTREEKEALLESLMNKEVNTKKLEEFRLRAERDSLADELLLAEKTVEQLKNSIEVLQKKRKLEEKEMREAAEREALRTVEEQSRKELEEVSRIMQEVAEIEGQADALNMKIREKERVFREEEKEQIRKIEEEYKEIISSKEKEMNDLLEETTIMKARSEQKQAQFVQLLAEISSDFEARKLQIQNAIYTADPQRICDELRQMILIQDASYERTLAQVRRFERLEIQNSAEKLAKREEICDPPVRKFEPQHVEKKDARSCFYGALAPGNSPNLTGSAQKKAFHDPDCPRCLRALQMIRLNGTESDPRANCSSMNSFEKASVTPLIGDFSSRHGPVTVHQVESASSRAQEKSIFAESLKAVQPSQPDIDLQMVPSATLSQICSEEKATGSHGHPSRTQNDLLFPSAARPNKSMGDINPINGKSKEGDETGQTSLKRVNHVKKVEEDKSGEEGEDDDSDLFEF